MASEYLVRGGPDDTLNELPSNHNPKFAPIIHPTLETGVQTLVAATCAWLAA